MTWSDVKIAIKCGGSDGRAAVERRVREQGFNVVPWSEFLSDLQRPVRMLLDFETRADESVSDLGSWKYSRQPSNEILCVGWTVRPAERRVLVAHNVAFEQAHLIRHVEGFQFVPEEWSCTASRARRLALPGSLDGACKAMRTPHQKSMDGHGLMLQCCQPRPTWKRNPEGGKWFDDAERLAGNAIYCAKDIFAERDLDDVLPELSQKERSIWLQFERANRRGLYLDVALISAMEPLVKAETEALLSSLEKLIGNVEVFLTSPAKVREFCAGRGVRLDDLRKETVEAVIDRHVSGSRLVDPLVIQVLQGRQIVGKTSNAKLPAMRARLEPDDFARDYSIYFGAHTGRPTGSAVNPLNLPKPYKNYNQEKVVGQIMRGDVASMAKDRVSPSTAVSATLRGTIIAPPSKTLVIGDYKTIEPCILFALAGQHDALAVMRAGGDVYCSSASKYYRREITKSHTQQRNLWKSIVIACGYQMGFTRFLSRLETDGVDVNVDEARKAYDAYRDLFPAVCGSMQKSRTGKSYRSGGLWQGVGAAALAAMRKPRSKFQYNKIGYVFDGWWLVCELPGETSLFYPNARIEAGNYDDEIVYDGRQVGGGQGPVRTFSGHLIENICQHIARNIAMEDKLELERRYGWHVPLDVYDEIVAEADEADQHAKEKLEAVMCRARPWLPEVPVSAECFTAKRYRKE